MDSDMVCSGLSLRVLAFSAARTWRGRNKVNGSGSSAIAAKRLIGEQLEQFTTIKLPSTNADSGATTQRQTIASNQPNSVSMSSLDDEASGSTPSESWSDEMENQWFVFWDAFWSRKYYYNSTSRESSWIRPACVPPDAQPCNQSRDDTPPLRAEEKPLAAKRLSNAEMHASGIESLAATVSRLQHAYELNK